MLKIQNVISTVVCIFAFLGCAKKDSLSGQSSRVTFSLPAGFGSEISTLGVACFGVNITATDIPVVPPGPCDGSFGVFGGLAPLNGFVDMKAPRGKARKLEIFYVISDTTCSNAFDVSKNGLGQVFGSNRVYKIGEKVGVDFDSPEVEVSIPIHYPSPANSMATLVSAPATCLKGSSPINLVKVSQARAVNGAFSGSNVSGSHRIHVRVQDQKFNLANPTNFSGSIKPARLGEK